MDMNQEMNSKPSDFSKSFKPFLERKKQLTSTEKIENDQNVTAEELSEYFSTVADGKSESN